MATTPTNINQIFFPSLSFFVFDGVKFLSESCDCGPYAPRLNSLEEVAGGISLERADEGDGRLRKSQIIKWRRWSRQQRSRWRWSEWRWWRRQRRRRRRIFVPTPNWVAFFFFPQSPTLYQVPIVYRKSDTVQETNDVVLQSTKKDRGVVQCI
ncbi:Uncharacterized protein Fot_15361 [Forsythia ovata]|uniref:Uncharacterized protein n=1 Tax=Forsythia ovata TaxID=205694 RepID=A0ABD1WBC5_9LAMI